MVRLAILKSEFVDKIEGELKWAEDGGKRPNNPGERGI